MQNGSNASIYETLPVRFSIPQPVSHLMLEAVTPISVLRFLQIQGIRHGTQNGMFLKAESKNWSFLC